MNSTVDGLCSLSKFENYLKTANVWDKSLFNGE